MIFGTLKIRPTIPIATRLTALLVAALSAIFPATPTAAQSGALDSRALIRRLAKPAPASIAFTEIRFSPLLQQPLAVSGTLGYGGPARLDRHVTRPYREATEIRGESVKVSREGEPVRSFALKRAPELQGLLQAFAALLAGDPAQAEKDFTVMATGNEASWQLILTPADARARRRVKQVEIDGREGTPRCFAVVNANEGASVMLLGAAADAELPRPLTREWITRFCAQSGQ